MITIVFIVAVVLLGRWLFNPKDWGKRMDELDGLVDGKPVKDKSK